MNGFSADVSVPGSVDRLARRAQNNFADKTIDVWINNAGTFQNCSLSCSLAYLKIPVYHPYVICPKVSFVTFVVVTFVVVQGMQASLVCGCAAVVKAVSLISTDLMLIRDFCTYRS